MRRNSWLNVSSPFENALYTDLSRLPSLPSIYLQCPLVARHIAHHRIAIDASKHGRRRAQRHATKLAVLYLEHKRGIGAALGIGCRGDAAKFWQCS